MRQNTITRVEKGFGEATTHCLPYNFDNRALKWSVWNLSLFLDYAELTMERANGFMEFRPDYGSNAFTVMIKLALKINPEVYNFTVNDDVSFSITTEVAEPGDSSYNLATKLTNKGKTFVERFSKLAHIDKLTRRAIKNSPQFMQEFSFLKGRGIPKELNRTKIPRPPDKSFIWKVKTRFSDLDNNMHVNQSLYIKSCLDCATYASMKKKLFHFEGDIIWYPVLNMSVNYLGESLANEDLTIYMWQDVYDISLLKFSIFKERNQITFIELKFGLEKFLTAPISRL